jgi:glycogen debranching enzyme
MAPTLYPVACSPQAWASGSVFHMLQSCLGLSFSAMQPHIRFDHPHLPYFIQKAQINNLCFGEGLVDLALRRHGDRVSINVTRKIGNIEVALII